MTYNQNDVQAWSPSILNRNELFWERLNLAPDPPKRAWFLGNIPDTKLKIIAIVGSRKPSNYGVSTTSHLIRGLAGQPVVIVSGLAFGIDTVAHQTAIDVGLPTIAFPGSGLSKEKIYPRSNFYLAKKIISSGGCLISELDPEEGATPWVFPKRNRLIAGISDAVVVIEASRKSGSVITANLALRENKEVLVVPGSIFSELSSGTNHLLSEGASPALSAKNILEAINLKIENGGEIPPKIDLEPDAEKLFSTIDSPISSDDLAEKLDWQLTRVFTAISILELHGLVEEKLGLIRKI